MQKTQKGFSHFYQQFKQYFFNGTPPFVYPKKTVEVVN